MINQFINEEVIEELMRRLTDKALRFIVKSCPKDVTWSEFEALWETEYPNESPFISENKFFAL